MNIDRQFASGFTIIELLVVISLMTFLFTLGMTSYNQFSRRQRVEQAAKKIAQDLRLAQSLADNNQKPSSTCLTLKGYSLAVSGNTYTISVKCLPPYSNNPVKTTTLASDLTLSGFSSITFKVLRQGLEETPAGVLTLEVSGFERSKTIYVGKGGSITVE